MDAPNPHLVARMQDHRFSVFGEMSTLARRTGAINLGQGFPDTDGPLEVLEAAITAIGEGHNQYPPDRGIASLRQAVADHQQRFYGQKVDPENVVISTGASESLAAAFLALLEQGDEVVVFEPYFDLYAAGIALAGAVRRPVTLRAPDYSFDPAELAAAVGPRTKMILLNTPHNPTGKVFDAQELAQIAQLAIDHDLLVVTDEVYEHMVYAGHQHVSLATLPGMAERTLTISSCGKTFSLTGWKVGWCHGPKDLVDAVHAVKQHLSFTSGAPFQVAITEALALGDDFYHDLTASLENKRRLISDGLSAAGFTVYPTGGTYYVTADVRSLGYSDGLAFCRSLPDLCGVVAVPAQVFYDHPEAGQSIVRFAYCKRDEVLQEAVECLAGLAH